MDNGLKPIWENPPCPMPGATGGTTEKTSGGFDYPDGRKETPSAELGSTITLSSVEGDPGDSVPEPSLDNRTPGTIDNRR